MVRRNHSKKHQKGAMIVDVAVGFCTIITLVFFFIETSFIFRDNQALSCMAREAARSLAAGASLDGATTRALVWNESAIPNASNDVTFKMEHSSDGTTWSKMNTTTTSGSNNSNDATSGDLIRVTATYKATNYAHFFGNVLTFHYVAMMRRE